MIVHEYLTQVPLFTGLTKPELERIAPLCRMIEGKEGDCLIREGHEVRAIYFIVEGEASIIKEMDVDIHIPIATARNGAILGEMALLENAPASATVEAKGPFKALVIDRAEFNRLMESECTLGYKIARRLGQIESARLRATSGLLAEYINLPQASGANL